ncbi:MAG: hypothetical protein Q8L64_04820 [bacterium]|nr:hypothetical protein [bacterium]
MNPKVTAYLELAILALLMALFLWWIYPTEIAQMPQTDIATDAKPIPIFNTVPTEAKAVYVYDVTTGKAIYAKNETLQLPLASLTKVMTALTASILLPDYALVPISLEDIATEGDSGLYADEVWTRDNLIDFSLLVSSNDGTSALASVAGAFVAFEQTKPPRELFIERMNSLAQEIGLRETYFLNPSGLDVSTSLSGGYGSAKDMAMLVAHILDKKPHLLEATSYPQVTINSKSFIHPAVNTNKAIGSIPNVLASKTGFTDLSGGNLVVAFDAGLNHPVVISILGSSREGRFTDMASMVQATLDYLAQNP